ncbi:hypothetical protein [Microbulbifer sediminum]|uniref:hypothetical protein n=1 Tax=Microbulbifer sediminum TaxID=2904250 RepID=UPI001F3B3591|nr:hypothetical protein [Microbulbifer sediminum]
MRYAFVSSAFLAAALATAPVNGDSLGRPLQKPGPMEYLEVTGEPDATGTARGAAHRRAVQALKHHGKREQLGSLMERQRRQLELFRLRTERLQAEQRHEHVEEEASRQRQLQEREAAQSRKQGGEAS